MPVATRRSPLALAQAVEIQARLTRAAGLPDAEREAAFPILPLVSTGDVRLETRLNDIGGKGLFTKEIDEALLEGRAAFAVHSMKDVPAELPPGLSLAAFPEREDPRDLLLTKDGAARLEDLPKGAVIGTASLRRQAQALFARPDLGVALLRGNVDTRLGKLRDGDAHATFLARAGLKRLGRAEAAGEPLPVDIMIPAPGQGVIGVAIRSDDGQAAALAAQLDHAETRRAVTVERAFMKALDGSCRTPLAAHARMQPDGSMAFLGEVIAPDGSRRWRTEQTIAEGEDPAEAGRIHAEALRAEGGDALRAAVAA